MKTSASNNFILQTASGQKQKQRGDNNDPLLERTRPPPFTWSVASDVSETCLLPHVLLFTQDAKSGLPSLFFKRKLDMSGLGWAFSSIASLFCCKTHHVTPRTVSRHMLWLQCDHSRISIDLWTSRRWKSLQDGGARGERLRQRFLLEPKKHREGI